MSIGKSKEEKEFLANYDIRKYPRPSLATDIAVFSIQNEGARVDIRKPQEKKLKILLIRRGEYPFKDMYALPGGFLGENEDVIEAARRELKEETNVGNAYLKLIGAYGEKGRDPRGWIVSNTFMALVDAEKCVTKAGDDAAETVWFALDVKVEEKELTQKSKSNTDKSIVKYVSTDYIFTFSCEEKRIEFSVKVNELKEYDCGYETCKYEVVDSGKLAFDHAKIILHAWQDIRENSEYDMRIPFGFMPEKFTLLELQNTFEIVQGKKLTPANFRRKIIDYVIETDEIREGEGFRPAKLYKLK